MSTSSRLVAAVFGVMVCLVLAGLWLTNAGAQSNLPVRARIGAVAADGTPSALPPPDPSYCLPAGGPGSTPPMSLFGTLTFAGQPAPAGTIVQVLFDGKPGLARATTQAGGYRLDFSAGGPGCANQVGAAISVLVQGQVFSTGSKVGDIVAGEPFRRDIAVP
jgi:hypothetical protein